MRISAVARAWASLLCVIFLFVGSLGTMARACEEELTPRRYKEFLSQFKKPHAFLRLVPGERRPHEVVHTYNEPTRLSMLYLDVRKTDDLGKTAVALAAGGDAKRIEEKLRKALRTVEQATIPLTDLLLPEIAQSTGQFAVHDGPNCFGAVACWSQNIRDSSMMYGGHFTDFLEDHARQLQPGEELHFGDILVVPRMQIRFPFEPLHASIYLNDEFVWEKASWRRESPWTFEELAIAVKPYGVSQIQKEFFDADLEAYRMKPVRRFIR